MTDLPAPYHAGLPLHRQLMPDKETDLIRSHCRSGAEYEFGKLMMLNPPTTEQRNKLQSRHRAIASNLSEHNVKEIAAAVADVMACYRNFVKPDEDPKKVLTKYVKELHGIPTWACVRACNAIKNNETSVSKEFPFSTLVLRDVAQKYIARLQDEAREISEIVLGGVLPPPVSPETKAKVARQLGRLAFQMKGKLDREQRDMLKPMLERQAADNKQAILKEYRHRGAPMAFAGKYIISPFLLDQLKQSGVGNADGGSAEAASDMEGGEG